MHPILFKCEPITIYSYGAMIVLAFFVSTYLAQLKAKKSGLSPDLIINLSLLILFAGIIGARLLYIAINIRDYIENPLEVLMLWHGGLAYYGGAIAALTAGIIYIKRKKISVFVIGDIIAPYAALGQAIGRIGCFLNGCCYGKPMVSGALYPTQIYSSISLFFLFLFLIFLQKRKLAAGTVLISYGLFYSVGRFMMEFLRGDNTVFILGMTFSQFVGAVIFFICAIFLIIRISGKYGKNTN